MGRNKPWIKRGTFSSKNYWGRHMLPMSRCGAGLKKAILFYKTFVLEKQHTTQNLLSYCFKENSALFFTL